MLGFGQQAGGTHPTGKQSSSHVSFHIELTLFLKKTTVISNEKEEQLKTKKNGITELLPGQLDLDSKCICIVL